MDWVINRFLKDKWVRYYNNPKNALRDYYLGTLAFHIVVVIIFIPFILPFVIFHIKLKSPPEITIFLALVIFVIIWELHDWILSDYLRYSWQPIKIKANFTDKGLEIINLFGKYRVIRWEDIQKIEYSKGRFLWGKYEMYEATVTPRPKLPPIIAPRKINIGLDLNIGRKIAEYWANMYPERAKNIWISDSKPKDGKNLKTEGGIRK